MRSLQMFAKGLSSSQRDNVEFALQDITEGASWSRLDEVERELKSVVDDIDAINKKREALMSERSRLRALLDSMARFEKRFGIDTEMWLVMSNLSSRLDFLSQRIAESRPDDKLKQKHFLAREKQLLEDGQKIGGEIAKALEGSSK